MGWFRAVLEINGDFGRKPQDFPTPVFNTPAEGFPWEFCDRGSAQKLVSHPDQTVEKFDDKRHLKTFLFSFYKTQRVWGSFYKNALHKFTVIIMCIRLDTIPECDGRTDGQTHKRTDLPKTITLCIH